MSIGQADAARDRRAGMRRRHRTPADQLREEWQAAARDQWRVAPPWWTPAVDAVTRSLVVGRDPVPSLVRLGRERAAAGVGLAQTLDDLNVLHRVSRGAATPSALARAAVAGWRGGAVVTPVPAPPPCWRGRLRSSGTGSPAHVPWLG